jgi:DNA-binding CsgD family transcriptional regulator
VQPEVAKELAYHAADEVLTNREVEVLKLIADGCSNKLVADRLHLRGHSKGHLRNDAPKIEGERQNARRDHCITPGCIEI